MYPRTLGFSSNGTMVTSAHTSAVWRWMWKLSCVGTLEMLKRVQKSDWWRTWSNIMTR